MKSRVSSALCATAFLAALSLSVACASSAHEGITATSAVLRGMVYNENRAPVGDATVSLMGKDGVIASTRSDVRGRYILSGVNFGKVTLHFSKPDYESLDWSFTFDAPAQVVYVRMVDLSELLDDAADSIQKRAWDSATSSLKRIRALDPENSVATYLQAQLLASQGKAPEAATLLERLAAEKGTNFAIELSLADLYQYKLSEPARALEHLKRALVIQDDVDVENRVKDLEGQAGP